MLRQKLHKFKFNGIEKKRNKSIIRQGIIGVKTLNVGKLTKNEVESSRKVITKYTKRNCKIWIKLNQTFPLTKKNISSRMGKGIGKFYKSIYFLKKGNVIFEVLYNTLISKYLVKNFLKKACKKLSIQVAIYYRNIKGI